MALREPDVRLDEMVPNGIKMGKYRQGHGLLLKMRNDDIWNSDLGHTYQPPPPTPRLFPKRASIVGYNIMY